MTLGTTTDHLLVDKTTHYTNQLMRDFAQKHVKRKGNNERYPHFSQLHFTAGDVEQFNRYRDAKSHCKASKSRHKVGEFRADIDSEVHAIYGNISKPVISDTFRYIFFKFKKGIYVKIRGGKLKTFLPFSNASFVNEYAHKISYRENMQLFKSITEADGYRFNPQKVNGFPERWYANNCLLRYEYPMAENDTNIPAIRDFLNVLTAEREIPDCDFFINKRDYPILAEGKYEPYNHIYDSKTHPLVSHRYDKYAPIFSFCAAKRHSDVIMPTVDDWIRVASSESRFYVGSGNDYFPFPKQVTWENKKGIALWRGSSTGAGTTAESNQRLKLCKLAETLMLSGSVVTIDAGITSWKRRPRKLEGVHGLKTIDVKSLNMNLVNRVSFNKHSEYKYIIHVEGHVAAYRLGAELGLGSVVLIVEGEYKLWFQRFLKDGVHFVSVKQDLSDLVSKIEWLQNNDAEAKRIAKNGKSFYDAYLCKSGILDYMQNTLMALSEKCKLDSWVDRMLPTLRVDEENIIPLESIDCVQVIKQSKKSTVHEGVYQDSRVVVKQSADSDLTRECIVGVRLINQMECSNGFVYTHGISKDKRSLITSHIKGVTFLQWMQSSHFSVNEMVATLRAVILCLQSAQREAKFMHNDLSLGNIILRNGVCHDPVIIDFERSRGISDSGDLVYCSNDNMDFNESHDVRHLLISTTFHLCRLKSAKQCVPVIKALCNFVEPKSANAQRHCGAASTNILKWAIHFTDLEGKFSRLTYKTGCSRIKTEPAGALEMLNNLFRARSPSSTICLTDIWEVKTRIKCQIKKVRLFSPSDVRADMAAYLVSHWEYSKINKKASDFSLMRGKQLVDRLKELFTNRFSFVHELEVEWMKRGLNEMYRAIEGDQRLMQNVASEYAIILNAQVCELSRSDVKYLFIDEYTDIVEKYSLLLEFKKIFGIINDD